MNTIDHIVTIQCSAWKTWSKHSCGYHLTNHPPKNRCRASTPPHGNGTPWWLWSPRRTMRPATVQNFLRNGQRNMKKSSRCWADIQIPQVPIQSTGPTRKLPIHGGPTLAIHQGMDYWGCPVVSGTRTLAVGAMDAQSLWNLGTLEARSMPWAWHVPLAIPEQFLQCSRVHCPAGGPPPPGDAVAIRVFTLSATVFGLNGACQVLSTWTPDPMFPSRTMHYHKMTSNIHLTSQCFECCGWLLYISEVRLNITNTYFG